VLCRRDGLSFSLPYSTQVLKDIYDFMTLQQSIVFVEMKAEADNVAAMMRQAGFEVSGATLQRPFLAFSSSALRRWCMN
jgi:hypothetical protein